MKYLAIIVHLFTYNYKKMMNIRKKWCRMNHLLVLYLTNALYSLV